MTRYPYIFIKRFLISIRNTKGVNFLDYFFLATHVRTLDIHRGSRLHNLIDWNFDEDRSRVRIRIAPRHIVSKR